MPPHRANAYRNNNQPPQVTNPLNENMSHAEFWGDFQVLEQAVKINIQGNH